MNVTLSVGNLKDALLKRIFGEVETAFRGIKQYAVVPAGGAAGSVLVKASARDYSTEWNTAAGLNTTVTLAKLTTSGANGSLTLTNGVVTAYTAPT